MGNSGSILISTHQGQFLRSTGRHLQIPAVGWDSSNGLALFAGILLLDCHGAEVIGSSSSCELTGCTDCQHTHGGSIKLGGVVMIRPLITQTEEDTCGSVICRSGCRIDDVRCVPGLRFTSSDTHSTSTGVLAGTTPVSSL